MRDVSEHCEAPARPAPVHAEHRGEPVEHERRAHDEQQRAHVGGPGVQLAETVGGEAVVDRPADGPGDDGTDGGRHRGDQTRGEGGEHQAADGDVGRVAGPGDRLGPDGGGQAEEQAAGARRRRGRESGSATRHHDARVRRTAAAGPSPDGMLTRGAPIRTPS